MPTGYTAAVQGGTVTEFADFALNCARAFGALVSLRDTHKADIPLTIEPSPYHEKAYAEEVARCENRTKWLRDLRESLK